MESLQRDISDERDARRPDGRDELDKSNSPATRPKRNRRDKRDNGIDMLNGPLPGKILRFAIPLALSSILQQLLNSADASIAGQFVSSFSLAGIGGVNPVTAMFVNLFVGLSIGANVVVAMHVGAGEFHSIKKSVHTAMALSLIAGVVLGGAGLALAPWVLDAIGMPEDSLADALTYVRLYFCAIPFLTIYNFGSALLRAHGDAKRPLYALAAAVVVNFVLDLAFVRLFGIGIATVIAAALSAVIVVAFLMREEGPFRLHLRELRICGPELAGILRIGIPAGIQGAVFSLSNTVVQATINGFGGHRGLGGHVELRVLHLLLCERLRSDRRHLYRPELRREERRPLPGHLPLVRTVRVHLVAYFGRDVHGVGHPGARAVHHRRGRPQLRSRATVVRGAA